MLLVIAFHFSDHGAVTIDCSQALSFSWATLAIPRIFGAICNDAFILISGYFLYHKRFSLKNIIKLWMQVLFYSITMGSICFFIGTETFGIKSLIKMFMPFTFNEYWFFSTYIVVYLLFPFINKLIDALDKNQHIYLILVGLFVFSLLYTIPGVTWVCGANDIPIFIVLYLIGAFFQKYKISLPKQKALWISTVLIVVEILSMFGMRIIYQFTGMNSFTYFVWGNGRLLSVLTSVFLFLFFKDLKIKHMGWVSFIVPSTFGIYLFHIGRLNKFLFGFVFNNSVTYNTSLLLPQLLLAMISIFIAGLLFDKMRILLFEKPVFKRIDKPIEMMSNKLMNWFYWRF